MNRLVDEIVPLAFMAVCAFLCWGTGYLIIADQNETSKRYEMCIESGQQWIAGNCVK